METKINVPTSLDGIKLSEYQDLIRTQSMSNDEEFIAQKMISIFCGIPLDEVVKIKLSSVNELIEHFSKLFSTKPDLQDVIVLDGVKYGFIPSLEDISYGEYIDLENSLQDWSQYHRALSVLYRPITGQVKHMYTIEDYEPSEARETVFKNAPVSVAISATVFFYRLGIELSKITLASSEMEAKKMSETFQAKDSSLKSGDSTLASMQSHRENLETLTRLQVWDFLNVSPISHSKRKRKK